MCIGLYKTPMHNNFYEPFPLTPEEWLEMMNIAKKHGVKYLLFEAIEHLPDTMQPPPDLHVRWYVETEKAEERFSNYKNTIELLAALLAKNDMPMLMIKGFTLARLYAEPARREGGDIDIFVFGKQQEADQLIATLYGTNNLKTKKERSKHSQFTFNGISVDNHINFVKDVSGLTPKLEVFYDRIETIIKKSISEGKIDALQMGEQTIYTLNPHAAAMHMITHLFRHVAVSATAIRHFCDWVMFFNHYRDKFDIELLKKQIEECGLAPFVANVEAFCKRRLMYIPLFDFDNSYKIYAGKHSIEHVIHNFSHENIGKDTISLILNSLRKIFISQKCYAQYLGITNYFDYLIPNIFVRAKQLLSLKK